MTLRILINLFAAWWICVSMGWTQEDLKRSTEAVIDLQGRTHSWDGRLSQSKGTVIVFINHDCPIANAYQPTIESLRADWQGKGYRFWMVYSDPDLTVEQAQKHAKEYQAESTLFIDPKQSMARHLKARATPEAFLLDANGTLQYRGRIDDRYVTFGKRKATIEKHDLRESLECMEKGLPIVTPETKPIGCILHLRKE